MYVILAVLAVFVVALLFMADRALKAIAKGRRRREAGMRLYAAAAAAQATERQRQAKETASKELTAVLPAIKKPQDEPRRVA
jgi:type II secretory pathway pseudopilin PulG